MEEAKKNVELARAAALYRFNMKFEAAKKKYLRAHATVQDFIEKEIRENLPEIPDVYFPISVKIGKKENDTTGGVTADDSKDPDIRVTSFLH